MTKRHLIFIVCSITTFSCLHMAIPLGGITIINSTKDSLYWEIYGYKSVGKGVRNMAFTKVTDMKTNATKDTIMGWLLKPNDTIRPHKLDTSYKQFAIKKNGLTILFFKKTVEKLPPNRRLTAKDIFRRVDVTPKDRKSTRLNS